MSHEQKWALLAPLGLATIGLGLTVVADAAVRKGNGRSWFLRGTIGLCLVNAGVSAFGDAVKERTLQELAVH